MYYRQTFVVFAEATINVAGWDSINGSISKGFLYDLTLMERRRVKATRGIKRGAGETIGDPISHSSQNGIDEQAMSQSSVRLSNFR